MSSNDAYIATARSVGGGQIGAQQLAGKAAVVTGAASGIGAATAELFARHGARVVCADIDEGGLASVVDSINSEFPGCGIAKRADVSSVSDVKGLVEECVSKFGKIDVFFANAGILNKRVPIPDEDEEEFMRTMSVNVLSAFTAIKYAGPAMAKTGGGSIICTASIAALRADLTPLQYAASKGAILSMVRSANDRFLQQNVRVNAILPGGVLTPIVFSVMKGLNEQGLELKGYDNERFPAIEPIEIAQAVVFLASDASSCVKGHALVADGGMSNSMGSQPYPVAIKSKM
mmetsp:Transcript_14858/g.37554  ORF Transcript_14858/g.37554 Transcript_14858/m.37554 type:complete len:289 (+) Transcript_14858:2-868(+)